MHDVAAPKRIALVHAWTGKESHVRQLGLWEELQKFCTETKHVACEDRNLHVYRSYEDLLSAAPSDVSQADKLAKEQARGEAAQQLEEARQKVSAWPPCSAVRFC